MSAFSVGEIAVVKPSASCAEGHLLRYLGEDVMVISVDAHDSFFGGLGYGVRHADGYVFMAAPGALMKKRPPAREDLLPTRWEDCPWQPKKEWEYEWSWKKRERVT